MAKCYSKTTCRWGDQEKSSLIKTGEWSYDDCCTLCRADIEAHNSIISSFDHLWRFVGIFIIMRCNDEFRKTNSLRIQKLPENRRFKIRRRCTACVTVTIMCEFSVLLRNENVQFDW